jgi:hypothetical protein
MSRRWKAESGAYGICNQPSPKFMHLLPLKSDRSLVCPVYSESFLHLVLIQNPVAIKLCIRIGRMSNQKNFEFIKSNFGIQCFWGGHGKNSSNPDLDQKVQTAQNSDSANQPIF